MNKKDGFPFDLEDALGKVSQWELVCPGVYYICVDEGKDGTRLLDEYYVVEKDSPAISAEAKAYGKAVPGQPSLLSYGAIWEGTGKEAVDYESQRYLLERGYTPEGARRLRETALFAMETLPSYFGRFPAPRITPRGNTLRYRTLADGVFWIETDRCEQVLALSYPVWQGDVSEQTCLRWGEQNDYDREHGIHETLGDLFFCREASCIPLFELLLWHKEWEQSRRIDRAALMNAVLRFDPAYAEENNRLEGGACEGMEEAHKNRFIIVETPGAGTDFLRL